MLERQWWAEVGGHLSDADSWRRVFAPGRPSAAARPNTPRRRWAVGRRAAALSVVRPRSRCPACGHAIALVREHPGAQLACAARPLLGLQHAASRRAIPLVELATAALFGAVALALRRRSRSRCCGARFAAMLVALALIDWDTTLLPDALTLPLLWAGLVAAALRLDGAADARRCGAPSPATCRCGRSTGSSSSTTGKEGMGYGDFKLLAALGAWLGWQMLVPIMLVASVIGAVVGIVMKLSGALREGRYVPFGPFLAGAGLAVMLVGAPTRARLARLGLTARLQRMRGMPPLRSA